MFNKALTTPGVIASMLTAKKALKVESSVASYKLKQQRIKREDDEESENHRRGMGNSRMTDSRHNFDFATQKSLVNDSKFISDRQWQDNNKGF